MSIARQRREGAAALAMIMRDKFQAMQQASQSFDEEAAKNHAVELALLQQNNTPFLIFVLETYAGSLKNLPGGIEKYADPYQDKPHDSLVEAVQADDAFDRATKHIKH